MIYKSFDVVIVPFPFTDAYQSKLRPALVISSENFGIQAGHSICVMITSARNSLWPFDVNVENLDVAGL